MESGRFIQQLTGYIAFEPALLPPAPPFQLSGELARLLSAADLALGRLDGITGILPNPDLFVAMYVRQEAVLSSQIEGTQASLTDVLQFEAGAVDDAKLRDVQEVVNYVGAMNFGLEQTALPLSLRLIREIHGRLLQGVRGNLLEPGEFRRTQNWIGPAGSNLNTASFVPPPPHRLLDLMGNLEHFLYDDTLPPLIHAGLAHAQLETIHPFLDGNGRMGRLLITFLLCKRRILSRPLLYLSTFLKRHRAEYYDRLQAVRESGAWDAWLAFFLRGVCDVATQAHETARKILEMRSRYQETLQGEGKAGAPLLRVLDLLFAQPVLTLSVVQADLSVSYVTANKYISRLQELGIVEETTGYKRNRRFVFGPYLKLFESEKALTAAQLERIAAVQATFAEFDGGAHEEWVREFAQDGDPEAEIVVYEEMAKSFTLFCSRRDLAPGARHEVYLILLLRSAASEEETLRQLEGKLVHLGVADVQQVLSDYTAPPQPIGVIVR